MTLSDGKTMNDHQKEEYLIYGKHPALACINNVNRKIKQIFCTERLFEQYNSSIKQFSYKILKPTALDSIIKSTNHQGIIVSTQKVVKPLQNLGTDASKILILDNITDPNNVGAIMRSAVAFGFDTIITSNNNSPPENGTIAKVSSGAIEYIDCIQVTNINSTIDCLKNKQFWIIGLDCKANADITHDLIRSPKIAIILGSEGQGLRPLVKKNCDLLLKIPMKQPDISSINVSAAAAVACYMSTV